MSKIRVPIWQQPNKYAVIDTDARAPATIGVNVFLPDGSLFNPATVAPVTQQPSGPPSVGGVTVTVWGAIQDVPQAVRKVEAIAGTGVLTRNAGGDLRGKALTAGANVTIVEDANSITLSATGGNTVTGTGGLWDLGLRSEGGRFDGGTRV